MIPTSTNVKINLAQRLPASAALAVFVTEKTASPAVAEELLSSDQLKAAQRLIKAGVVRGKAREIVTDLLDSDGQRRLLFLVGLGGAEKIKPETLRDAAGALARAARKHRIADLAIALPKTPPRGEKPLNAPAAASAIISGFLLASFKYEEYKGLATRKKEDEDAPKETRLTLLATNLSAELRSAADRSRIISDAQNFARTIAFRPGNDINPPALAKVAQDLAKEVGLTAHVLDEKQLRKLNMGGILAVGQGSKYPPRLIVLEYRGSKSKRANARSKPQPLLVVGKAITFDTGGISIKPADKMQRMIFDKCGAMAVLGLMYAIARLKPSIPVVGILSSAENHISGDAYRPGDILRMYNGVTVEVTNTDAEGRLVLGDALAWGIETYNPSAVVDLATLTGGVVVALGKTVAGVMSNNDQLFADLQRAADNASERIWRLPVWEEHREYMKSEFADIVNSGGREGHPLQGAAFLSHFIASPDNKSAGLSKKATPWAHLDIAGVADTEKELPCFSKGATGWGVRTLVEWVTNRQK